MNKFELTQKEMTMIAKVLLWGFNNGIDISLRSFQTVTLKEYPEMVFHRNGRYISFRITPHDRDKLKEFLQYECQRIGHELLVPSITL